jgi:hypothetical protein
MIHTPTRERQCVNAALGRKKWKEGWHERIIASFLLFPMSEQNKMEKVEIEFFLTENKVRYLYTYQTL